jgi:hypothetical protein
MQDQIPHTPVRSCVSRIDELERRITAERRLLARYYGYPPSDHPLCEDLIRQLTEARKAEAGHVRP